MRDAWKWGIAVGVLFAGLGFFLWGTGLLASFLQAQGLDNADRHASVLSLFVGIVGVLFAATSTVLSALALRIPRTIKLAPLKVATPAPGTGQDDLDSHLEELQFAIAVDHDRLFGVEDELQQLGRLLANPHGDWIISILGEAGVGKTALAYDLVMRFARQAGFRRVAAVSAKFSYLDQAGRLQSDRGKVSIDWRDLLVELAGRLRLRMDLRPDSVEEQLPLVMPAEPCLMVIDNLETVAEAQVVVNYLASSGLLRPHKVVLTTRAATGAQAPRGLRERRWTGPDRQAAQEYARYLAGDDRTLDPRPGDLMDVVEAAQRIPLLIKIIISQAIYKRLPIREVIARLRERGGVLGSAVWSYCYADSLNALAARVGQDTAELLMSVYCTKKPSSSFTVEELRAASRIEDPARFEDAVAAACNLSLMQSLAGNTRFTVHSLLRQYYCGALDA
ncbi:ATP-binding protein [Allorhizocola rhizosphaerae]|uniref:ATP-binding protein n=1 Tax=Allorhizocola rhizosphaerae TaxID=1872709 RepID=UPI000E3D4C15|nr:ATP-binding protein [Allorhizocola rhizosphaerae]